MSRAEFVSRYGPLFEHSPWVAERAYDLPGETLHARFMAAIFAASEADQLSLIRAHPELAAKIALTDASAAEQSGAGLRALTPAEFDQFAALNRAYREKFGFPFIICVRLNTKASILAAFESRLANNEAAERLAALTEIGKIAELRLKDLR